MSRVTCVWSAGAILGESPVYDPRCDCVLFVDIKGCRLFRLNLSTGERSHWDTPDNVCWVVPRKSGAGYIAAFRTRLGALTLEPFAFQPFASPDQAHPNNRFNDAKVGPDGAIWAGSMDDAEIASSGALFRIAPDLTVSQADSGYCVANGPTFSPDGAAMYHADSARRTVWRFDLAAAGGISGKRVFITFPDAWGYPDGMTTDAEGYVWIAHWQGGRVSRFSPDGALDRSIPLPVSRVTSCAFGGADRSRMFITTAMDDARRERNAGALFECDPGVCGIAPALFGG